MRSDRCTALPTLTSAPQAGAAQKLIASPQAMAALAGLVYAVQEAAKPGPMPLAIAGALLDAAVGAFDNGYILVLAITAVALAAGSAFTYRYLKRQPATPGGTGPAPRAGQARRVAASARSAPGGEPPQLCGPERKPCTSRGAGSRFDQPCARGIRT
jgi:hypothetical protein